MPMSAHGTTVWTGRALQVGSGEWVETALVLLYPALWWSMLCSWPTWISARIQSHSEKGRWWPIVPPDRGCGGDFHLLKIQLADPPSLARLPGRSVSLDVARLRRSRARTKVHSCGFGGGAWRIPPAPASHRGQGDVVRGSHDAFLSLPLVQSGMAVRSRAGRQLVGARPSRAARSHHVRGGLSGETYSCPVDANGDSGVGRVEDGGAGLPLTW